MISNNKIELFIFKQSFTKIQDKIVMDYLKSLTNPDLLFAYKVWKRKTTEAVGESMKISFDKDRVKSEKP